MEILKKQALFVLLFSLERFSDLNKAQLRENAHQFFINNLLVQGVLYFFYIIQHTKLPVTTNLNRVWFNKRSNSNQLMYKTIDDMIYQTICLIFKTINLEYYILASSGLYSSGYITGFKIIHLIVGYISLSHTQNYAFRGINITVLG